MTVDQCSASSPQAMLAQHTQIVTAGAQWPAACNALSLAPTGLHPAHAMLVLQSCSPPTPAFLVGASTRVLFPCAGSGTELTQQLP